MPRNPLHTLSVTLLPLLCTLCIYPHLGNLYRQVDAASEGCIMLIQSPRCAEFPSKIEANPETSVIQT